MPAGFRQWAGAAGHVLPRPEASQPQSLRERDGQRTESSGSQLLRAAASQRAGLWGVAGSPTVCQTPLPALRHRAHKPSFLLRDGEVLGPVFWQVDVLIFLLWCWQSSAADVSELVEKKTWVQYWPECVCFKPPGGWQCCSFEKYFHRMYLTYLSVKKKREVQYFSQLHNLQCNNMLQHWALGTVVLPFKKHCNIYSILRVNKKSP